MPRHSFKEMELGGFWDVNLAVEQARKALSTLQEFVDMHGWSDSLFQEEVNLKIKYSEALRV